MLSLNSNYLYEESPLKTHARVVIIGGGSLGVNLLYHLTKEGWSDIALLEKGELTSGSTWHAAGLCPSFNGNMSISQIHQYTMKLYDQIIPKETGEPSTFHRTGSLRIGYSALEEQWFRHLASRAKHIGCRFELIDQQQAQRINPLMDFSKAHVIVSTPDDGHVDPTSVVMPLAQLARQNGADIYRFTQVEAIQSLPSGEWSITTNKGNIIAEHVVNAAGCFAREVGQMVGVDVPIINLEHQYLVTDDLPILSQLDKELPVCRDSYTSSYIRQEGKGLLVGPYETFGCKPWALDGMDWGFDRELFAPDLERLMPFLERCMELTPAFAEVGVKTVINGPITHTPDDNLLAGPQAGLRNFWNLCGASIGIAQGGIGKFMAQWMVHGQTEINMAPLDSRRFGTWANKEYCIIKSIEAYENMYTPVAPNEQRPHARPARHSPLYSLLNQKGAVHGVTNGYEKPLWFKTKTIRNDTPSWAHSDSHQAVNEECLAVRDQVGVTDLSGSSKFEVTGADAGDFLNHLSANKLPEKDGRIGLTLMHAPNGGIRTEMSVTRIHAEHYYLNSALASELQDLDWLESHVGNFEVTVHNRSESIAALLITGPQSRKLLQQLTQDDLSDSALPWLSASTITLDSTSLRIMRVSYAGELGFELHMPSYQLLSIYTSVTRIGASLGLRDFGTYALNSLRMEKAYRAYGHEFTEEVSGIHAGMQRFIDLSRPFIGSQALNTIQSQPLNYQLAYLVFDDELACECFGNESVRYQNQHVGIITSGAYGHRINRSLAFAYLPPELVKQGTTLSVDTALGIRQAHIESEALYDPSNQRLRASH